TNDVVFRLSVGDAAAVNVTLPAKDYQNLAGLKAGLQNAINSALGAGGPTVTVGDSSGKLTLSGTTRIAIEDLSMLSALGFAQKTMTVTADAVPTSTNLAQDVIFRLSLGNSPPVIVTLPAGDYTD